MGALEAKCDDLAKLVNQLQPKLLDLEARSQRLNIKIVGIKEGSEEGRPTEFISNPIPELLGKQHFPHPLKVDHAHRSLWPMPAVGEKQRTISNTSISNKRAYFTPRQDANDGVQGEQSSHLPRLHQ